MSDEPVDTCGATAQHPTLDLIGCELPAGHEGAHKFDPQDGEGLIEWDDQGADERPRAAFDVDAFVKNLPKGVCLCPMCLGMGAVVEEPPFDPRTKMCTTCAGGGKVRTGSTLANHAEHDCADCNGSGFVHRDGSEVPASPARADDVAGDLPPRDSHGRTPDDPDFDWRSVVHRVDAPEPAPAPEPAGV